MTSSTDPIAALATAPQPAAVAIIRLSGAGTLQRLTPLMRLGSSSFPVQRLQRATMLDLHGRALDDVLVVRFAAPRSYTGEEAAEIHCHGGPFGVRALLKTLYASGFRPAEPGEFTRRAFLNGKLDLTAAEGIRELAGAESEQQWLAARQLATGRLRSDLDELRASLIQAMAYLEAQIDFPDEGDTATANRRQVAGMVRKVEAEIERLLASYEHGRVALRGLSVALLGEPNAGKSSLLNALLQRERALVTEIPGTTRDWLEENVLVAGRLVRLIDMAGIRDAKDPIERMGIEAARNLAKEADFVLLLAPADAEGGAKVLTRLSRWVSELGLRQVRRVLTKADLGVPTWAASDEWLHLSTKTGLGMPALKSLLQDAVDNHLGRLGEQTFVTTPRHVDALSKAQQALAAFAVAHAGGAYEEMLAFELQTAARALQSIVGGIDHEDVLDKVFATFCVGK